ncbi:hypothetical protein [Pseudomonas sp. N040]|uniref:hypothetical protein n=1 Tax=Pseudomonas sp. N040 TaxID=2785325 RepID=UPI0018A2A420|nr:hypothetical protein [Pseudomonas sp. N040]MBF7730949.1 hypothetical protein [Pseudomonas sp. N040]MBW7014592.1 hypothetical protein [Pseudomonas sp. N040]
MDDEVRALKLETSLTPVARKMLAKIAQKKLNCAINQRKRIIIGNEQTVGS